MCVVWPHDKNADRAPGLVIPLISVGTQRAASGKGRKSGRRPSFPLERRGLLDSCATRQLALSRGGRGVGLEGRGGEGKGSGNTREGSP